MRFALTKTDITPAGPVFLAGFGARDYKSEAVHDPIYVKTVLLEANKTLLILAFDLIGGDRSFVKSLKEALFARFGLAADDILINFSHTHCSLYVTGDDPDLSLRRGYYSIAQDRWPERRHELDYAPDIEYYRHVERLVLQSVEWCRSQLIEGTIEWAKGSSDTGISRRLPRDGSVWFAPNPDAPIDKDLHVIRLLDSRGSCRGLLFSYGCHPTTLMSDMMSAEFVGVACSTLEQRYPDCVAVFLQGCGGDVVAARRAAGGSATDFGKTIDIGRSFAGDVVHIMTHGEFRQVNCRFRTALADVRLYTQISPLSAYTGIMLDPQRTPYERQNAARVIEAVDEGTAHTFLPMYIAVWDLDERTKIVALEGEIPSGYGLMVKELFPQRDVVVLGYSNGVFTYVPTRNILEEGGYEAEAYMYHGFRGPFVPEMEDIIVGRVARM